MQSLKQVFLATFPNKLFSLILTESLAFPWQL